MMNIWMNMDELNNMRTFIHFRLNLIHPYVFGTTYCHFIRMNWLNSQIFVNNSILFLNLKTILDHILLKLSVRIYPQDVLQSYKKNRTGVLSMVQAHIYKEKYMHSWIILFSSYHVFKYYSYAYTNIRFLFLEWTYSYDRKTHEVPNRKPFKTNFKLLLVLRFENVSIVAVLMD